MVEFGLWGETANTPDSAYIYQFWYLPGGVGSLESQSLSVSVGPDSGGLSDFQSLTRSLRLRQPA